MKAFDIKTFNKNKNNLNEYILTKDNYTIRQVSLDKSYYEFYTDKNSLFEIVYEYYKTGKLKTSFVSLS